MHPFRRYFFSHGSQCSWTQVIQSVCEVAQIDFFGLKPAVEDMPVQISLAFQIPWLCRLAKCHQKRKTGLVVVSIDVVALREEVGILGATIRVLYERVERENISSVAKHGIGNYPIHEPSGHGAQYSRSKVRPDTILQRRSALGQVLRQNVKIG